MRRPQGGSRGCPHHQKAVDFMVEPYGTVVHGLFELTVVEYLGIWVVTGSSHITPQAHQPGTLWQWSKPPCSYSSRSLTMIGHLITTCFPPMAHRAWETFHLLWNCRATSLHPSRVTWHCTSSSANSSMIAWQTSDRKLASVCLESCTANLGSSQVPEYHSQLQPWFQWSSELGVLLLEARRQPVEQELEHV